MKDYRIEEATSEDLNVVERGLVEYNLSKVPLIQEKAFIPVNLVVRDSEGQIVAGVDSRLYCWNCCYVDMLWVKEENRKCGYGNILLNEVERVAKEKGAYLIHLDTFDFQAKDFYLKHGYEIFGVLEDCPKGHNRYYLKKNL
ncbi:GNAT family N-acetyltransferase [Inconstantimicrobium mannanitabidum]|uniref:N-acetyltransferase n=1 Tax=Inconstantimicrobium mannanitabidum TaxID=1604901 RepID=A0ACB5R9L8_9CLOT|nr:GNAT family N-acetyltransferase [Clostridium sp. TW13]GKX65713.1 N-acetyltransferase [Clostridium sp. TW13]